MTDVNAQDSLTFLSLDKKSRSLQDVLGSSKDDSLASKEHLHESEWLMYGKSVHKRFDVHMHDLDIQPF